MRLLYLAALTFVFIVSVNLAVIREVKYIPLKRPTGVISPLPVLAESATFPVLSAQGVIATDLESGVFLYEKNPDQELLPASTTKIMTALVAFDYYPRDLVLEVPDIKIEGQKMGLIKGEKITVESLLYGLLVYSANDAAEALAQNYPGGRILFIEAMNLKARELHLDKTRFVNPSGLDSVGHYSTARDMTLLAEVAMRDKFFSQIVSTKEIIVRSQDGKIVHRLKNINELLGEVEGVRGVKTGWTESARENLVTYVERGNKKILIGLLGSQDRFGETKELIDWIYENYSWTDVSYSP